MHPTYWDQEFGTEKWKGGKGSLNEAGLYVSYFRSHSKSAVPHSESSGIWLIWRNKYDFEFIPRHWVHKSKCPIFLVEGSWAKEAPAT